MYAKKDTVGQHIQQSDKISISSEDINKLQVSGNITFNKEQIDEIEKVINQYIVRKRLHESAIETSQIIKRAESILKSSQKLENFFSLSTDYEPMDSKLIHRLKSVEQFWDIECDFCEERFTAFNQRLEKIIEHLSLLSSNRDGPEGDELFNQLIYGAMNIYIQASYEANRKKKKGTGQAPFIAEIVNLLPNHIRPVIQGDVAFKQRIKVIAAQIKKQGR